MRTLAVLVTGVALVLSTACGAAPAAGRDLGVRVLTERAGVPVHLPPGGTAGAPLVVVLHGLGGHGRDMAQLGWSGIAEQGAVVAYPTGTGRSWNAGLCCGTARDTGVDDVGGLETLVADLQAELGTDPRRVYAAGFSNGAMMTYRWACDRPGRLAGIGLVSGTRVTDCPEPGAAAVVALHGDSDTVVPLGGGVGPDSVTGVAYPSLQEALSAFRSPARCAAVVGCGVTEIVLPGLDHTWPADAAGFIWERLRDSVTPAPQVQ